MSVTYNNDYWTAGGGGGASGGIWGGSIQWSNLNNPGSISVIVGGGGAGVNPGGQTTGSTTNGVDGYVQIGLGKIVGYTGGSTGTSTGDIIASGSQSNTVWDVNIVGNGTGTGSAGNFKLPTTQIPDVYINDGGATADKTVGSAVIQTIGSNTWCMSSVTSDGVAEYVKMGGGSITLGGVLDRIRLTNVGGQTFDHGSVNIAWEY